MRKILSAAAFFLASPAFALTPLSYSMPNGETGTYTYWDDSYSGSGSKTTSLSPLSGGLGDLTDGVIATQRWDSEPGLYVGWASIEPTITFNFAAGTVLSEISFYFDNALGYGGVFLPTGVGIDTGSGVQLLLASITNNGEIARYSYDLGSVSTDFLSATIYHSGYVMLTETTFSSSAAPELASWMMMVVGFGVAGVALRRRSVAVRFA